MADINHISNQFLTNSTESSINDVFTQMTDVGDHLYRVSNEKYERKEKLIEEAKDMSTIEKLDALEDNSNRHAQEIYMNLMIRGLVTFLAIIIIKKIN